MSALIAAAARAYDSEYEAYTDEEEASDGFDADNQPGPVLNLKQLPRSQKP